MAENLEENEDVDCDKEMDSLGYKKEHFDRFIHDYRETAQPHAGSSRESDTPMDAALKKDFVNAERKLKKAFYTVRRLPDSDELCSRIESVLEIFKTKKIMKEESGEEFSLDNVPLPDYDPTDIGLLLGEEFVTAQAHEDGFSKIERKLREQVIENIKKAEVLLKESDEAVRSYKAKALQNMQA